MFCTAKYNPIQPSQMIKGLRHHFASGLLKHGENLARAIAACITLSSPFVWNIRSRGHVRTNS